MSNTQSKFQKESSLDEDKLTNPDKKQDQKYFVYLLQSTSGNTYVGATIDVDRRLRQHNKELKGGAHATSIKVNQGETWTRIAYVINFPDWQSALQFEWRWKQLSRKYPISMNPLKRRLTALKELLSLEKSTTKAKLYTEWEIPPKIIFETNDSMNFYDSI